MSVDSKYFIQPIANDGGVEYTFEMESIGADALDVYSVTDSVKTLIPTTEYAVSFGYRDPINTRGKITLNTALTKGSSLQMQRSTPITNTQVFPEGKPFPSEAFEYAIDKMTFILQELEGTLCDCRTVKTTPGHPGSQPTDPTDPPGPPPPTAYLCNAVSAMIPLNRLVLHVPLTDPSFSAIIPVSLAGSDGEMSLQAQGSGGAAGNSWTSSTWGVLDISGKDYTPCTGDEVISYSEGGGFPTFTAHASGQRYLWGQKLGLYSLGAISEAVAETFTTGSYDSFTNGFLQNADFSTKVEIDTGAGTVTTNAGLSAGAIVMALPAVDLVEGFSFIVNHEITQGAIQIVVGPPSKYTVTYECVFTVWVDGVLIGTSTHDWEFVDVLNGIAGIHLGGTFVSVASATPARYFEGNAAGVIDMVVASTGAFNSTSLHAAYIRNRASST